MTWFGLGRQFENGFVVAPEADPARIRLALGGVSSAVIDGAGDLVLLAGGEEMRQHRPVVYQDIGARRVMVDGRYVLRGREVSFAVGPYDRGRTLTIDPLLGYSTYLGGNEEEEDASAVAIDRDGVDAGVSEGKAHGGLTVIGVGIGAFAKQPNADAADAFGVDLLQVCEDFGDVAGLAGLVVLLVYAGPLWLMRMRVTSRSLLPGNCRRAGRPWTLAPWERIALFVPGFLHAVLPFERDGRPVGDALVVEEDLVLGRVVTSGIRP